jgi:dTDP-4-dehydrorhamnose reductase
MIGPVLIFGGNGQVGREFACLARARGLAVIAPGRQDVDIADAAAVKDAITRAGASVVINCAAYTSVDKAEVEPAEAARVNALGAGNVAIGAAAAAAPLIHLSTDYVFDGTKAGAYREEDDIAPLGVYGRTKAEGESAVRTATPRHVILRTSWVFGVHGRNFLKTMLLLARQREELRVVADQHGCPTATADIARALLAVVGAIQAGSARWGVYHFAGRGVTSWHGFATEIVEQQARFSGKRPPVRAIGTAEYPTPARRPANSELDSTLFAAAFGYRAETWQKRTAEAVATLMSGEAVETGT